MLENFNMDVMNHEVILFIANETTPYGGNISPHKLMLSDKSDNKWRSSDR